MALGKPKLRTKFELLASIVAEILKQGSKILGAPLAQSNAHFLRGIL